MPILHILILAIVQGITEPLPVSSSGHLVLTHRILDGNTVDMCWEQDRTMDIAVHVGTLFSVLAYYWRDILTMIQGVFNPGSTGFGMAVNLVIASIPVVGVGLLIHTMEPSFVCMLEIMAWMLIVFGILLWVADKFSPAERTVEQMTWKHAILIGIAQCCSLMPGVSRSGSTMTAGRFLGYSRIESSRFSLLLAVVAVSGAGVLTTYELVQEGGAGINTDILLAGFFAFLAGYGAIAFMVKWLQKYTFTPFAIYRIALGAIVLGFIYTGAF